MQSWIDLGLQSVALGYREAEASELDLADDRGLARSLWMGAVLGAVVTGLVGALETTLSLPVLTALGVGVWMTSAVLLAAFGRRARPGRARPRRWRRPLPCPELGSAVQGVTHGVLEGQPTLHAPLSGEACLGWTVRVYSEEGLLLDEQSHAPLSVDGRTFEADTVTLDLAPRGTLEPTAADATFVRFMQRRGLSPHDSSLRIYEAHVLPGVPVALHQHGQPRDAGPVLTQAPRDLSR